jgi:hypothetical protein
MILLYASPHEVKYIKYPIHKFHIGVGMSKIRNFWLSEPAVLFGSCGLIAPRAVLTENHKLDMLVECGYWYNEDGDCVDLEWGVFKGITTEKPVHNKFYREVLENRGFFICDMESYHVAKVCKEAGVEFRSIRYVIDLCDKKVMPIGLNWAWREWQHYRMQKIFERWLKGGLS